MIKEKTNVKGVAITSPERLVFLNPHITKRQLAEYYAMVSDRMMKYAGDRILSVVRCHNGTEKGCFIKKHPNGGGAGISTIKIESEKSDNKEYFFIEKSVGFVSEIQLGTVEFHCWASRTQRIDNPDSMVFDLDSDEGMNIDQVRRGAKDLKLTLDE